MESKSSRVVARYVAAALDPEKLLAKASEVESLLSDAFFSLTEYEGMLDEMHPNIPPAYKTLQLKAQKLLDLLESTGRNLNRLTAETEKVTKA